jgi:hypothetical protein
MRNGFADGNGGRQESITDHVNDLNIDGARAFIMTPKFEGDDANGQTTYQNKPMYETEVNTMQTTINEILPKVHVEKYFLYEAVDIGDGSDNNQGVQVIEATSRGRALFQYDPNNRSKRSWRLYFQSQRMNDLIEGGVGDLPPLS